MVAAGQYSQQQGGHGQGNQGAQRQRQCQWHALVGQALQVLHDASPGGHEKQRRMLEQSLGVATLRSGRPAAQCKRCEQQHRADHRSGHWQVTCQDERFSNELEQQPQVNIASMNGAGMGTG